MVTMFNKRRTQTKEMKMSKYTKFIEFYCAQIYFSKTSNHNLKRSLALFILKIKLPLTIRFEKKNEM